jgi:hypothetical protein
MPNHHIVTAKFCISTRKLNNEAKKYFLETITKMFVAKIKHILVHQTFCFLSIMQKHFGLSLTFMLIYVISNNNQTSGCICNALMHKYRFVKWKSPSSGLAHPYTGL